MSDVDRPIFLIGTGRCGSSLLLQLLGYHPDLAWISHYTAWLPGAGRWATLSRLHEMPGLGGLLVDPTSRLIPQPTESYRGLIQATDGLFVAPRELEARELTPIARDRLRALAAAHTRAQGKPRFLMKHTGFPRVAYLRAAFPDARFVHVVRDGRSVAASLCRVDWWSGEAQWGWGRLSDEDRRLYIDSGYHELVLAGLYWKVLMEHYERARAETPADALLEIRYDALVSAPRDTLAKILEFVDLPRSNRFDDRVRRTHFLPDDDRWRRGLTDEEVALLERTVAPALRRHGFAA
ncbi:MAG TPA: sulfotransferase [Myxococcota bacterium]|nr:sulfotransferase [Myxococcota bacterium]